MLLQVEECHRVRIRVLKGVWMVTLSNAITTWQTSKKYGLLSLLWQFCAYLFVPQRRPKADTIVLRIESVMGQKSFSRQTEDLEFS